MAGFGKSEPYSNFGSTPTSNDFGEPVTLKDCWRIIHMEALCDPPKLIGSPSLGQVTWELHIKIKLSKRCECVQRPNRPVCPVPNNPNWGPYSAQTANGGMMWGFFDCQVECTDCGRILGEHAGADEVSQTCEPDWGPKVLSKKTEMKINVTIPEGADPRSSKVRNELAKSLAVTVPNMVNQWIDDKALDGARAMGYTVSCCGGPNPWDG